MRAMGWHTYYSLGQGEFQQMSNNNTKWGDLSPYTINYNGQTYYGQGIIGSPAQNQQISGFSPAIQLPSGLPTRITVKYFFYEDANEGLGSYSSIYATMYKDGDTDPDSSGSDSFGATNKPNYVPSVNTAEPHQIVYNINGQNINWVIDDQTTTNSTTLSVAPQHFKIWIVIQNLIVAGLENQSDAHGIVVYELTCEYYDYLEDMFSQMFNMMFVMMFVMMGVMVIKQFVVLFRSRKKEEVEYE